LVRQIVLAALLLQSGAFAHAKEFGHYELDKVVSPAAPGTPAATVDVAYLDKFLDDLAAHARTFPARFDSVADRRRAQRDVASLSSLLDPSSANFAHSPEILLRLGRLYAMGHNLDIPDSADKAVTAFTALLELTPDDPQANYQYGAFLAATTRTGSGIPFLERAKAGGVVDAEYWLGMSYLVVGNKAKAKENLESYAKRVPNDRNAARMLDAIRDDKVEIQELQR
jgi:predicted Zn-dependent protease